MNLLLSLSFGACFLLITFYTCAQTIVIKGASMPDARKGTMVTPVIV